MIELSHAVRPSKKEAYEIILDLKTSGVILTDYNIDRLINFFAPPSPKIAKTVEQWVAKAAATKNEVRFYLQFLYVEDGVIYATDGNRVHWGETTWLNGFYDPKTLLPAKCDAKFPNVKRIIDQRFDKSEGSLDLSNVGKIVISPKANAVCVIENEFYVNDKYFNDAVNGLDSALEYRSNGDYMISESNPFGSFIIGRVNP